ncbi:unnamed protein product [Cuscuta epithymum]|uniref:TATA box-binding protein-associated factor RNA polymerase I subunit B n=2 Tax=Cuscuta epithymum TaxID=186058 RepID=A0AAV0GHC4_9ASTE|nr:unnamed protein product [Cuscuta epithymum]
MERLCDMCGNLGLKDGDDGFFYCTLCGCRADDVMDTAVEEAVDTNRLEGGSRIYSASQTRARPRHYSQYQLHKNDPVNVNTDTASFISPESFFSNLRVKYIMGVQIMIQLQCKALVEKFNVSPLIIGLISPIWLRYVAHERVMADDWGDQVIKQSESQTGELGEFQIPVRGRCKGEPHNLLGKRLMPLWCESLRSKIPLSTSLAISYLVCHLAREAILPTDIVNWVLEGKLPYLAAFVEIEKQLGPPSMECPLSSSSMFRPIKDISSQKLESFAASIARRIGLQLPPVNFYALASRYLSELSLPVENILPHACRVHGWSMPPQLYLSDNECSLPSRVYVMSIIIVAMRIMYDINGGKWEMMLSEPNDHSMDKKSNLAEEEVNFDGSKLLQILVTKYSEHKHIHDYALDLPTYLQHCKDVVFAGLNSSLEDHEEESLIDELWDLYEKSKDAEPSDDHRKRDEMRESGGDFNTTGDCPKCPSDDSESPVHESSKKSYKDQAVRQMKSNMEENRFSYLPPIKSTSKNHGYIRYARKKDGALIYAVHADYYIILRSCAQIAQIDMRTLHMGVLTFQRWLEQIEKKIDICLRWNHRGDSCDFCRDGVSRSNAPVTEF